MKKLLFATALSLMVSSVVCAGGLDASEQKAAAPKKAVAAKTAGFDLMHPFWGPAQGQFASDTTYQFTRTNGKHVYNGYAQSAAEKILYGLTDNWTLFGSIGRNWGKQNGYNWHNKTDKWSVGTSYNFINDGKTFLQGAVEYMQAKNHDHFSGKTGKSYGVEGTYGYNLDSFTPYVKVNYANSANLGPENDAGYGVKVAAYKQLTDKIGSNLGVRYNHQTSSSVKGAYTLEADTSYMLMDNVAFRVFGDYLLHQDSKEFYKGRHYTETQNKYSIGAGLKAAF